MAEEPFLARLVVIRRDEQRRVDSKFLGQLRLVYGVLCGI